jgi:hypothetical protein
LIAWIRFLLGVALIGWAYQADTSWPVLLVLSLGVVRAEGGSYLHNKSATDIEKHSADIVACATAIRDIAQWTVAPGSSDTRLRRADTALNADA